MTLPNLASSAVNFSSTGVTTATFTRPTATGGTVVGDLLIGVLNVESTSSPVTTGAAFTAIFGNAVTQLYNDGALHVGYRRAAAGDPATWAITMASSSAYQAFMFAYRNVAWVQDRRARINASSVTITGIADLAVAGPDQDVLPVHIIGMDQEATARTLTPGAGHSLAFNSEEATTFLRTTVLHGVEQDATVEPLTAINSTLSVAEAHAIVAYTLAGVAYPSGIVTADGSDLPHTIAEPFPISLNTDIVGDPPLGGGGATVPTVGQLWPRGV